MKRLLIALLLLVAMSGLAQAQTTVNFSVVDTPDNQAWNSGTWAVQLQPKAGDLSQTRTFVLLSGAGSLGSQSGNLSATGTASVILPANANIAPVGTVWIFTVCPQAASGCFQQSVTVSTSSPQTLTIIPPSIRINLATATPPIYAYADGEILNAVFGSQYYNLTTSEGRECSSVTVGTCIAWIRIGGVSPWIDVTRFGVRTCTPSANPCNPFGSPITAATTSNQSTVTISGASSFINGDGVVIYGAGAPHSMATPSAPTVTPSVARVLTGTRDTVPGPTGATTYNYQIFAEDKNGGLTAVSAVGTTTTGATSLGSQSATLTSCTRTNDVVTCTTATPHTLAQNTSAQMVYLTSTTDPLFSGFYSTSNVADSTHFSFTSGMDTRNGAATSTTGGTVFWFNCNHITWTAVTGAYRYWIAGRTGGSLTTIGYSWPSNSPITVGVTSWDDFGATMMGNLTLPRWIPTTPPVSATSDHLSTTILSGAGTTSLILAGSAGTTIPSATILLDAVPGIKAAIASAQTSAGGVPPIFFPIDPTGKSYVVNSFLDLTANVSPTLQIPGGLYLNNTIELPNASKLVGGSTITDTTQSNSFQFETLPIVTVSTAYPGIHITNGAQCRVEGITFAGNTSGGFGGNNYILIVQDGGGGSPGTTYNRVSLSTGNANDYMGIGVLCRGLSGTFSCPMLMDQIHSITGPNVIQGASATPAILCTNCPGNVQFHTMMIAHRGIFVGQDLSGGTGFKMDWAYEQGSMTPLVTMAPAVEGGTGGGTAVFAGPIVEDTVQTPLFTHLAGNGNAPLSVIDHSNAGVQFSPTYSGLRPENLFGRGGFPLGGNAGTSRDSSGFTSGITIDGTFAPVSSSNMGILYTDGDVAVGPSYGMFIDSPPMTAPSAVVSAGGSVPIGSFSYQVAPIWQNGGVSIPSSKSASVTTTTGNQTITVTWTPVAGNCKGYIIWRNSVQLSSSVPLITGCSSNTYVDTLASPAGASLPTIPAGGPTMLLPGTQGIASGGPITVVTSTFANLGIVPPAGVFKYCTDCTTAATCAGAGTGHMAVSNGTNWTCQ